MNPFFCRIGSKTPIADKIIRIIPEHKTYVEPFVGSGAIFFAKEPSEVEVLNDLDKDVATNFKLLKDANEDPSTYNIQNGVPAISRFVNKPHYSPSDKILKNLYMSCNTFGSKGIGKIYNPIPQERKINRIKEYKDRLNGVRIYNTDYRSIIEKYDSPSTFFFLDPPYENSEGLYKDSQFDYEELASILKNIKGKFLLTLNDSRNIRRIFKDFIIKGLSVKGQSHNKNTVGFGVRKEVFIMNYRV